MLDLWLKILDIMDRLMNSGQGDSLVSRHTGKYSAQPKQANSLSLKQEEAIPESLKNILLVMADGGYLIPPSENKTPSEIEIWEETRKRVDRFLPDLFREVFPQPKAPPPTEKEEPQEEQKEPHLPERSDSKASPEQVETEKAQEAA